MIRPRAGFTLPEVLIAMLFISIAVMGYVALHIRILYSDDKLQQREVYREQACCQMVKELAAASLDPSKYPDVPDGPRGLKRINQEVTWQDRTGTQKTQVETWVREVKYGW